MNRFLLIAIATLLLVVPSSDSKASIIIDLTQQGSGVLMSISGSGTITTGTTGPTLNFNNFASGSVYRTGFVSATTTWDLVDSFTITGLDFNNGNNPYSATISQVRTENSATTSGDDFDLLSSFSFGAGDTFQLDASSMIDDLLFSDLNVGTYTSNASDAGKFGGVTLNINRSVPEPVGIVVWLGMIACGISRVRCRR